MMNSLLVCLSLVLLPPAAAHGVGRAETSGVDRQCSCSRQGGPGGAQASEVERIPTVEYKELVRDPGSFDKKVIRVTGFIINSFELIALYEPDRSTERALMTWVGFDEKYRTSTRKELAEALDSALYPADPSEGGQAKITAVGLFEVSADFDDDPNNFKPGFGHMSMYRYRLTINCVERVEAVKKK
jgi:hypothetical protein